ncbi:MAG TPA: MBOAT family protein [Clostridiales bacterium]|nr:MBOAT family protein [Clostridiales bacterium]
MVFSSLEFLFLYLPATLLLYFAVPKKYLQWRNVVLLVTSLIFYGWGEPVYVFLMIATILVDYVFGFLIDKYREAQPKKAKGALVAAVIINLGILGVFKYYDFVVSNLRLIPGLGGLPMLNLELPIGISFYTFQALSYVIDIYRRDARVQKNPATFGVYVTLFPQLIAGPIVRYKDIDEMLRYREESVALFASGIRTFLAGFAKKILLANIAGEIWSAQAAIALGKRTVVGSWLGMIFYAFQIYFDFSGYSDMAIGLGKMFGFRFLENFNYPYIARSITDFWRRWHMSLSTWFREYVYFPLGGSRRSTIVNIRNLFVVWLLTGVWHGASWNYVLWGFYYFVLLVIEKQVLLKKLQNTPAFFQHLYTLFFVLFGWLLFVFEDMSAGVAYLGNMFGVGAAGFASQLDAYNILRLLPFITICVVACTPLPKRLFYRLYENHMWVKVAAYAAGVFALVLGVSYLVNSSYNPFLYFRF